MIGAMTKVPRNAPCPCGSGQKAKRCCHGPTRFVDVRVMPLEICQQAVDELAGTGRAEIGDLYGRLIDLPETDLTLQVPLPGVLTPDMDRAVQALRDDDVHEFDRVLPRVLAEVDSVARRVALAQAVLALRDAGAVPRKLAALAVIELDSEDSAFFMSSVAESLGVLAGDQRTPGGLLVATR